MFPKVNQLSSLNNWDSELTHNLFDTSFNDQCISAIDAFMFNNKELNKLIFEPTEKISDIKELIISGNLDDTTGRKIIALLSVPVSNPRFLNLILLGYISSVEAYFRQLIRNLVNLDQYVKQNCELQPINYGTTYYQTCDMFPESLMDGTTFIKSDNIKNECNKLLGVSIQVTKKSSLEVAFKDFDSICQLRHCIVHRFGKIGVNNIIKLGIHKEDFKDCIEKPITMNFNAIQKASKITVNIVRELNQTIWTHVMKRLQNSEPPTWTWDLRSDKSQFRKYLNVFYESSLGPVEQNMKSIYDEYRKIKDE